MKTNFFYLAIVLLAVSGCYYDKQEVLYGTTAVDCNTISAKFSADINPIIQAKCATAGCHDASGASGGVVLLNYAQVQSKADRINIRCVVNRDMPPGSPLTQTEVNKIKCWIQSGALNN